MVDDEIWRNAEELRDTAAKLKLLARRTQAIHARGDLLNLAERFERMARCMDSASSRS
jgi:chorismate-pyruvate lyase